MFQHHGSHIMGFHLKKHICQSQGLFDFEVLQLPHGSLGQVVRSLLGDLGGTLLGEPPGNPLEIPMENLEMTSQFFKKTPGKYL